MDPKEMQKKIRDSLMSTAPQAARELVDLPGGEKGELRQPTLIERDEVFAKAGFDFAAPGKAKFGGLHIACVMACLYVPGTDYKVFGPQDEPALNNLPPGSFVDEIGAKAWALMHLVVDAGKGSGGTPPPPPESGSSSA